MAPELPKSGDEFRAQRATSDTLRGVKPLALLVDDERSEKGRSSAAGAQLCCGCAALLRVRSSAAGAQLCCGCAAVGQQANQSPSPQGSHTTKFGEIEFQAQPATSDTLRVSGHSRCSETAGESTPKAIYLATRPNSKILKKS
jgi:hypothetical protein